MTALADVSSADWERILTRLYGSVSDDPRCKSILADIGQIRFQLLLHDRPELSYWEEYTGERVVAHLGVADESTVQAATTFSVLTATMLRQLSLFEAAADEAYDLRGDTTALMRCVNLLPYVMNAFPDVVARELRGGETP